MARIALHISDLTLHLTLKILLEARGHTVTESEPQAVLADRVQDAAFGPGQAPVVLLCTASERGKAVAAMRKGAFGYVLLPLEAGELELMLERVLEGGKESIREAADSPLLTLEELERVHILRVLRACKQNQAHAARILGIGRNTLWRKLRQIEGEAAP